MTVPFALRQAFIASCMARDIIKLTVLVSIETKPKRPQWLKAPAPVGTTTAI